MKRNAYFPLSVVLFLVFAPGCGRIIDWGKERVPQATDTKKDVKVARDHIRSIRVYDQFTLIGNFDSLWLSDDVRNIYAQMYALKHGKSDEASKVFLRRQLEENNHFISFYIVSVVEETLGETDSNWTVFLKIGENQFTPIEVKTVDLSSEYVYIFGKKFNRFKIAYIVRFNAKDIEDQSLIQPTTDKISLVFKTVAKEITQEWLLDNTGKLKPAELVHSAKPVETVKRAEPVDGAQ